MRTIRPLAAALLLTTIAAFASAQEPILKGQPKGGPKMGPPAGPFDPRPGISPSAHIPVPTDTGTNVRTWIEGRRGGKAGGAGKGLVPPEGISPEMLRQIAEMLKDRDPEELRKLAEGFVDPKDPQSLDRLKKMVEQNPDFKDPKKFEDLLEEMRRKGENPGLDPKKFKDLVEGLEKIKAGQPPVAPPKVGGPPDRPGQNPGAAPPNVPDDRALKLARELKSVLGDSEALAGIAEQLQKAYANGATDKSLSFMPDLTKEMGQFTNWTSRKFQDPNLNLNLPKFNGPKVNLPNAPRIGGRWDFLPSFSFAGFAIGGLHSLLVILFVLAMVLFIGYIAWRKGWFPGQQSLFGSTGSGPARLDIDSVQTREELVQAFEAISVDQCGEEATTWNHRIIAGELGAESPMRQEAAGSLAGLYEHARYAPSDDGLTGDEFAKARRDISTLCAEERR